VIVHLLEYQVLPGHAAEVAGFVSQLLDAPMPSGLLARCAGRRLSVDGPRYILVSVWQDLDAFRVGTNASGVPRNLASQAPLIRRRLSAQFRSVESHVENWCEARVLRLHRTSLAQDALAAWERGVLADVNMIAGKSGNLVAFAGVAVGDETAGSDAQILVLTAWRDWDALLDATGGRLNRPILGTETAGPQPHSLADHYEPIHAEANDDGESQPDSSG
jgi:hypothetical protein